jgi:CcmD family protein
MDVGDAAPYVAGAYVVVFVALLAYMWLIGSKLGRLEERLDHLRTDEDARSTPQGAGPGSIPPESDARVMEERPLAGSEPTGGGSRSEAP